MREQFMLWLGRIYTGIESREEGQALVEYALILALIAVVAIPALVLLGNNIFATLNNIAGQV
jgi:pilus assembly protein Flp/PilA